MTGSSLARHCAELNRCNQRGGRMLSILDLLDDGTLDLDLAAYLMARMRGGASLMVGAVPGGAGKTTVMCALLNLVPPDLELTAATAEAVQRALREKDSPRRCYICHEIGSGFYFAYLWGRELCEYCSLFDRGHVLATNLHADDLEEAREQVCDRNGVPKEHFNRFDLQLYLRIGGGFGRRNRRIDKVYSSTGGDPHVLVYDASKEGLVAPKVPGQEEAKAFLAKHLQLNMRTVEEVRSSFLECFQVA